MKKAILIPFFMMVILSISLFSCKDKISIPDYPYSQPSSINALRKVDLKENLKFGETEIVAIVTSDIENGNIDKKTLVVQDKIADAAIVIILEDDNNNSFLIDDEVTINLEGGNLQIVEGELQIYHLANAQVVKTGKKSQIIPKSTSIATLIKNASYWGPVLIKLDKVSISNPNGPELSGQLLIDDEIIEVPSLVLPTAAFSQELNPGLVEAFIGIIRERKEGVFVNLRNINDLQVGLSEQTEDFEQASSTNYNKKTLEFITGNWTIDGGITATSASDPKNGKQSIRLQGTIGNDSRNGIVEMNFDLLSVKTISISHGIYPASAELTNVNPTLISVQISKDEGKTYEEIGEAEVDTESRSLAESKFDVNAGFSEKVRFRIVNKSLPFANNNRPRINIDDIVFEF